MNYEGSAGAEQAEQDQIGVDAEGYVHPTRNAARLAGDQRRSRLQAVVHAWNEFLAEEYCAVDRDRLLAMGMIPMTGVDDAIAELEYCKRAGLRGICLSQFPSGKSFPSLDDDLLRGGPRPRYAPHGSRRF